MTSHENSQGWIRMVSPELEPPSLKDNTADAERLIRGLKRALRTREVVADLSTVKRLPSLLRARNYEVMALVCNTGPAWRLMDVFPVDRPVDLCGLAVDLGSSRVVIRLVDLTTGDILEETAFTNPQTVIGQDILTRIHFASRKQGLDRLQGLLRDRMNREIADLTRACGMDPETVVGMCVAGNTTMSHIFLGLDPCGLCREPYIPVINSPPPMKPGELGLSMHPEAPVLVLPNVGSYFGGDLIAGILNCGMADQEEVSILVDVGTNAEVVLGNREWLMACAGAAGPALEGGVAGMGMTAARGVIDKVRIDPISGEFQIRTIEGGPPLGICGSGLIDLAAQLFMAGMIDERGKFIRRRCGERLKREEGIDHLVLVPAGDTAEGRPITLSQTDMDSLLRSKAAMYSILATVTGMVNIPFSGIRRFYIAGTFGSFIDPVSAVTLGMIPDLPLDRYRPLGNTSLAGATEVLLSLAAKEKVHEIRDMITYVELNVNQEFMNRFNAAKFIPHTDRDLFPSVEGRLRR